AISLRSMATSPTREEVMQDAPLTPPPLWGRSSPRAAWRRVGGACVASRGERFLLCWFAAYLVFFSLVRTKLPNYVLPLYPALAILTARFLVRWREGEVTLPRWLMPAATGGVVVIAVALAVGLLAAGGTLTLSSMRTFPGLEQWAVLG